MRGVDRAITRPMTTDAIRDFCNQRWDESILPALEAYIRIPALSPHFDPEWKENGHIHAAVEHIRAWCAERPIAGLTVEVVEIEGRTPVIWMEIPAFGGGDDERTILLYGHLDKQPEMSGWDADKGPWKPVRQDGKLYGRGGADDGYAAYASLTAIEALQRENLPHHRCVVLIEGCEESGSFDLPAYLEHLTPRLGEPELVVCLDSGCGNYDQLWCTTSLRGLVGGVLTVEVMEPMSDGSPSGVHSGRASGVVPSTFRVLRTVLERVEDPVSGALTVGPLTVEIPAQRVEQAEAAAAILGDTVFDEYPLASDPLARGAEALLNRTWRPYLEVTGVGDVPDLRAGNVLRGRTRARLSVRLPPPVDADEAAAALKAALEKDPPYGARVTFEPDSAATGWDAPPVAPWLDAAMQNASRTFFDRDAAYIGEGGTIPFMGMLGEKFPQAQFLITGLLGPMSNAHGPNEFLHIECAKRLTMCVASILTERAG